MQTKVIAPLWPSQVWCPEILRLTKDRILHLPGTHEILKLKHKPGTVHRLVKMR